MGLAGAELHGLLAATSWRSTVSADMTKDRLRFRRLTRTRTAARRPRRLAHKHQRIGCGDEGVGVLLGRRSNVALFRGFSALAKTLKTKPSSKPRTPESGGRRGACGRPTFHCQNKPLKSRRPAWQMSIVKPGDPVTLKAARQERREDITFQAGAGALTCTDAKALRVMSYSYR